MTNEAHKLQVEVALRARYFSAILQLPAVNNTPEQHDKNRLSRSLAAFAIEKLAGVAPSQAANAVVDGGNDNGLDAVMYDIQGKKLWVIQSKSGDAANMGEWGKDDYSLQVENLPKAPSRLGQQELEL